MGKTLSAKVTNEQLQENWENWVEEQGFDSMSEAMRAAMREVCMEQEPRYDVYRGLTAGLCGLLSITLGHAYLLRGFETAGVLFLVTMIVIAAAYQIPFQEVGI